MKIIYAGMALVLPLLSTLETKADNPFTHFKPYEQENLKPEKVESSNSQEGQAQEEDHETHLE